MRTIRLTHNGFHGRCTVRFRPIETVAHPLGDEDAWRISAATARRLNAACCPNRGCECGEHIADIVPWCGAMSDTEADGYISIPAGDEIQGYYPHHNLTKLFA